tara:strand:- start:27011 stop:28015 length:1005 start_codon:yes stop_codon:yes gene_type:complete
MQKTIIIAEAGINHNGDIKLAKKLIDVASDAKADYIKFQTFKTENLVTKIAKKADYQKSRVDSTSDTQFEMLKSLELNYENHIDLIDYCKHKSIKFLSSAFDLESIDFLESLDIDLFKIPSGEITNFPYLKKISLLNKPVVLSTGMATINDIENALSVLTSVNLPLNKVCILHCNTSYPTPMIDVNLKAMNYIAEKFNVKVGYSDHTLGIEIPIAAVALGASIIEKHLTLDREMFGPDHFASLEPVEFSNMVSAIKNINFACSGDGIKKPTASELENIISARKSIVAKKNITKGELFSESNLTTKRPGSGISPMKWEEIIGKTSKNNYEKDQLI